MAQTVGTCVDRSCDNETCLLQALAQINRVFPTAVSPTRTHFTNSWCGCSLSILPLLCALCSMCRSNINQQMFKRMWLIKKTTKIMKKRNFILSLSLIANFENSVSLKCVAQWRHFKNSISILFCLWSLQLPHDQSSHTVVKWLRVSIRKKCHWQEKMIKISDVDYFLRASCFLQKFLKNKKKTPGVAIW